MRLSFSESAEDLADAGDVFKILEHYSAVFGVERDQAVAAVDLEVARAVKHEDTRFADLDTLRVLNEKNVAVVVLRLHTVAADAQSKVRSRCRFGDRDGESFSLVVIKVFADARGDGKIVERDRALFDSARAAVLVSVCDRSGNDRLYLAGEYGRGRCGIFLA